ncbi:16S rRNA (cytosine(1402)-N(4))-methyltransferase RsmH [Streptomonospora wellingtoniae]|uniref:Ribosomal RNA small subunit methyltransferase H n=1 Tax=Streptomonospora wellingtoniae TaxID=3075544 RepID=A0ABU2KPE8_9ACTN|nr:16S rRNA (cytosine(1402)-N(4))-methyltransferase RsmH [Streptomonospora sp. DSM 45055]MDT0301145.1 16S rRNA (cytosine(1402)-N(4))-methyltransferase RsmH [Streptomonospora sp. DSM 45055]
MADTGGRPGSGHTPVMLDRIVELLSPALSEPGAVLVDGTLGLGGHAAALLDAHPRLRLVGVDRDTTALERSRTRLAPFGDRVELAHAEYDDIPAVLDGLGVREVQAVLLDLGVSSPQLDESERGFAYSQDAPLDMRMDRTQGRTAADVLNTYSVSELARILREYGEERFAGRIAQAVARRRAAAPLDSTRDLAELVRDAIPAATRRTGGNPAKRTFQALRIEVNAELEILARALPEAVDRVAVGGRIAVLSYHSLEDRITKRTLSGLATDTTPEDLPVPLPDHRPQLRLLTRGSESPTDEENDANPRAASARLRAAERVRRP